MKMFMTGPGDPDFLNEVTAGMQIWDSLDGPNDLLYLKMQIPFLGGSPHDFM